MSKIIESAVAVLFLCLICFYGMKLLPKCSIEEYLSIETTTNIRGLLAVGIVIHHAAGYYTELSFISVFRHVGYLIVALFFFLSGYGVQYGYENKKKYMGRFLRNRLCVILIPYWIATTLEFVLLSIFGASFSPKDYILSMFLIKLINGAMWYIQVLILLYFVYWISHVKNENMLLFWTAFFVLFSVFLCFTAQDLYYKSILAFPLGVYWYKYREKLLATLDQVYIRNLVIVTIGLVISFCVKVFGTLQSITLITSIGNMSSAVMLCVFFGIVLYKLQIGNILLNFLGNLSFEIYLIHFCCLNILWKCNYAKNSQLFFITVSLGLTLVLAKVLNQMNKLVLARLKRNG